MVGCAAVNCTRNQRQGFRLFRFPTDVKRRDVWRINTRRDKWKPSDNSRLCEVHFEQSQFEANRADGKKKLTPYAIPTLFEVPNPPKRINPEPRKSVYRTTDTDITNAVTTQPEEVETTVEECTCGASQKCKVLIQQLQSLLCEKAELQKKIAEQAKILEEKL